MSKFRILVGVKRVVDYAVRIRFKPSGGIEYSNVKHSMNPFDEIAVEEALRIKTKLTEQNRGFQVEVVVASVGGGSNGETLRTALAMGADRAIHVNLDSEVANSSEIQNQLPPLSVARILAKLVEREEAKLILLGKQAIDDDSNATGQMLAGLLDYPQATFASKVELMNDEDVEVTREVDGGVEVQQSPMPLIVTTDLRLNEPRYATLPNIMKAKSKPMQVESLQSLGLSDVVAADRRHFEVLKVYEPPKRVAGVKVGTVDELIAKLRTEAGVLQ